MPLTYRTNQPEETLSLGQGIAKTLKRGDTILLFGDLGSGKTQLTKGIALGLGIQNKIKSPTFAYVNQYPLSNPVNRRGGINPAPTIHGHHLSTFYHYDLYRLNTGDDTTSLGLEDSLDDPHAINVIEWADRMIHLPQKFISINAKTLTDQHEFNITFIDPEIPNKEGIETFLMHFQTPLHVRDHMKQVANVAMQIAQAYADVGHIVNTDLLYTAAILHDVARVCDFRSLDKNAFQEDITDKKWQRWTELRQEYKDIHHPTIARDFLAKLGYQKTGELIYAHGSGIIMDEPECLESLEAKLLYYADKRVKHDEIVSLKERFEDGRVRYGQHQDEITKAFFRQVEEKTLKLEKTLFAPLNIHPGEIL